jgi:hypothetical protein
MIVSLGRALDAYAMDSKCVLLETTRSRVAFVGCMSATIERELPYRTDFGDLEQ